MENKRRKLVKFYSGRHLRRLIASDNILDTSNVINDSADLNSSSNSNNSNEPNFNVTLCIEEESNYVTNEHFK